MLIYKYKKFELLSSLLGLKVFLLLFLNRLSTRAK